MLIGIIGGAIAIIFAVFMGPLYSAPLIGGKGGFTFYFTLLILPPIVVLIGGVLVKTTRLLGSVLMWIGGVASIIGYGLSPACIFGILFIYGGFKGFGDPVNNSEITT